MKILVIGGTGHMGSYLVDKLVANGHDVYVGSRGETYQRKDIRFEKVHFITLNSKSKEEVRALREYNFDVVVDFPGTAYNVWCELKDNISHLVACGSLWMMGYPHSIPTPEIPQGEIMSPAHRVRYGEFLEILKEMKDAKAVFSAVLPPNVCGPGKVPIDQLGGRSVICHRALANGDKVYLPSGPEALIAPCDAEDIASLFALIIENRKASSGEMFNAGAKGSALTVSELIKTYGKLYGAEIPIEYVPFEEYKEKINTDINGWWHLYSHMCPDITKAKNLLGYEPKYTSEESMERAVRWLRENKLV